MSKGSTSSDAPFGTLLGYAPGGRSNLFIELQQFKSARLSG
ncbi:Bifunctional glutathionylspermidine synthetase/amidase [Raoultella planticola]|uniref:Bifunctional glutathionylspermidine synthetase/amidase n=1 Tax=Raoultella planticola TaxID=575 RepID=A0A485BKC2_RAOPL|nr:Bifunctional glutathionylspermidine synthetase/amidase [Raoultella planticola]